MLMLDFLKEKFPAIMAEYDKAPWDWKMFGPMSLEDLPVVTIYLYFGKKKREKLCILHWNFAIQAGTVEWRES